MILNLISQMAELKFEKNHNAVANFVKTPRNTSFHEIIDFLVNSPWHQMFSLSPQIYQNHINDFWETAEIQRNNQGVTSIHATVQSNEIIVTEASIRTSLGLDDAAGIYSLPYNHLLACFRTIGYEGIPKKSQFKKNMVCATYRLLMHYVIHCLTPRKAGWDELSSNAATAVVCLIYRQPFNLSRMIFYGLLNNLSENNKGKFVMFPRFLQILLDHSLPELPHQGPQYEVYHFTDKVFGKMKVNTSKSLFSKNDTELLPHMLVINVDPVDFPHLPEGSDHPDEGSDDNDVPPPPPPPEDNIMQELNVVHPEDPPSPGGQTPPEIHADAPQLSEGEQHVRTPSSVQEYEKIPSSPQSEEFHAAENIGTADHSSPQPSTRVDYSPTHLYVSQLPLSPFKEEESEEISRLMHLSKVEMICLIVKMGKEKRAMQLKIDELEKSSKKAATISDSTSDSLDPDDNPDATKKGESSRQFDTNICKNFDSVLNNAESMSKRLKRMTLKRRLLFDDTEGEELVSRKRWKRVFISSSGETDTQTFENSGLRSCERTEEMIPEEKYYQEGESAPSDPVARKIVISEPNIPKVVILQDSETLEEDEIDWTDSDEDQSKEHEDCVVCTKMGIPDTSKDEELAKRLQDEEDRNVRVVDAEEDYDYSKYYHQVAILEKEGFNFEELLTWDKEEVEKKCSRVKRNKGFKLKNKKDMIEFLVERGFKKESVTKMKENNLERLVEEKKEDELINPFSGASELYTRTRRRSFLICQGRSAKDVLELPDEDLALMCKLQIQKAKMLKMKESKDKALKKRYGGETAKLAKARLDKEITIDKAEREKWFFKPSESEIEKRKKEDELKEMTRKLEQQDELLKKHIANAVKIAKDKSRLMDKGKRVKINKLDVSSWWFDTRSERFVIELINEDRHYAICEDDFMKFSKKMLLQVSKLKLINPFKHPTGKKIEAFIKYQAEKNFPMLGDKPEKEKAILIGTISDREKLLEEERRVNRMTFDEARYLKLSFTKSFQPFSIVALDHTVKELMIGLKDNEQIRLRNPKEVLTFCFEDIRKMCDMGVKSLVGFEADAKEWEKNLMFYRDVVEREIKLNMEREEAQD